MIKLNDYLYSGHTVIKILHLYRDDLEKDCQKTGNFIDKAHVKFLKQQIEILEHNDFLTDQSNRILEIYKFMAKHYPYLSFTFKGRIKSLIRSEEKFNGYVSEYIYNFFKENKRFPSENEFSDKLNCFRDLIAYRFVLSVPKCHESDEKKRKEMELNYLYDLAKILPKFLEERGFTIQKSESKNKAHSTRLNEVHEYFRDYIENPNQIGYQSLHLTLFDNVSQCFIEIQLRTKEMDDYAEIGGANHDGYVKMQKEERTKRREIPEGANIYFDEAYERQVALHNIDFCKVDVDMFGALSNDLMNDCCGLIRGRLILPFEHLSGFQSDDLVYNSENKKI